MCGIVRDAVGTLQVDSLQLGNELELQFLAVIATYLNYYSTSHCSCQSYNIPFIESILTESVIQRIPLVNLYCINIGLDVK